MAMKKCLACGSVEQVRENCRLCGSPVKYEGFSFPFGYSEYYYYYKILLSKTTDPKERDQIARNIQRSKTLTIVDKQGLNSIIAKAS